jgi:Protein of unknown function (DUF2809)
VNRLAGFALLLGVACFFYPGPGRAIVRGHVGDAAAAMLVYAVVGGLWRRGAAWARLAVSAGIVSAIELRQVLGEAIAGLGGEILFGATFDPWDFVAYALGLVAALAWDRYAQAKTAVIWGRRARSVSAKPSADAVGRPKPRRRCARASPARPSGRSGAARR